MVLIHKMLHPWWQTFFFENWVKIFVPFFIGNITNKHTFSSLGFKFSSIVIMNVNKSGTPNFFLEAKLMKAYAYDKTYEKYWKKFQILKLY